MLKTKWFQIVEGKELNYYKFENFIDKKCD